MTPLMQRGFDDAKANGIDPVLGTADTAEGREYRDGHRQARRDGFDGFEREYPVTDLTYFAHPSKVGATKAFFGPSVNVVATAPVLIGMDLASGPDKSVEIWRCSCGWTGFERELQSTDTGIKDNCPKCHGFAKGPKMQKALAEVGTSFSDGFKAAVLNPAHVAVCDKVFDQYQRDLFAASPKKRKAKPTDTDQLSLL